MLIDLTQPLNTKTPVYPGDPPTKIEPAGVLEKDGWCDHYISLATHVGTHIDAPAHMLPGGKTLEQFPVEKFIGRGICIDFSEGYDIETLKQADIQVGDIVLFHTGASERYHEPSYYEQYPVMPPEVANYLVERKVNLVGFDACQPDQADTTDFPIHKILLSDDVLLIENLTNLDQLVGKSFKIFALPIKLEVDGAPARVVAELKDD